MKNSKIYTIGAIIIVTALVLIISLGKKEDSNIVLMKSIMDKESKENKRFNLSEIKSEADYYAYMVLHDSILLKILREDYELPAEDLQERANRAKENLRLSEESKLRLCIPKQGDIRLTHGFNEFLYKWHCQTSDSINLSQIREHAKFFVKIVHCKDTLEFFTLYGLSRSSIKSWETEEDSYYFSALKMMDDRHSGFAHTHKFVNRTLWGEINGKYTGNYEFPAEDLQKRLHRVLLETFLEYYALFEIYKYDNPYRVALFQSIFENEDFRTNFQDQLKNYPEDDLYPLDYFNKIMEMDLTQN
jgi:hypothetical protein